MTSLLACDDNISWLGLAVRAKHAAGKIRGSPSEGVKGGGGGGGVLFSSFCKTNTIGFYMIVSHEVSAVPERPDRTQAATRW